MSINNQRYSYRCSLSVLYEGVREHSSYITFVGVEVCLSSPSDDIFLIPLESFFLGYVMLKQLDFTLVDD